MRPTIVALTQDFSYGVIEELRTFDAERTGVTCSASLLNNAIPAEARQAFHGSVLRRRDGTYHVVDFTGGVRVAGEATCLMLKPLAGGPAKQYYPAELAQSVEWIHRASLSNKSFTDTSDTPALKQGSLAVAGIKLVDTQVACRVLWDEAKHQIRLDTASGTVQGLERATPEQITDRTDRPGAPWDLAHAPIDHQLLAGVHGRVVDVEDFLLALSKAVWAQQHGDLTPRQLDLQFADLEHDGAVLTRCREDANQHFDQMLNNLLIFDRSELTLGFLGSFLATLAGRQLLCHLAIVMLADNPARATAALTSLYQLLSSALEQDPGIIDLAMETAVEQPTLMETGAHRARLLRYELDRSQRRRPSPPSDVPGAPTQGAQMGIVQSPAGPSSGRAGLTMAAQPANAPPPPAYPPAPMAPPGAPVALAPPAPPAGVARDPRRPATLAAPTAPPAAVPPQAAFRPFGLQAYNLDQIHPPAAQMLPAAHAPAAPPGGTPRASAVEWLTPAGADLPSSSDAAAVQWMDSMGGDAVQKFLARAAGVEIIEALTPLGQPAAVKSTLRDLLDITAALQTSRAWTRDPSDATWADERPDSWELAKERLAQLLRATQVMHASEKSAAARAIAAPPMPPAPFAAQPPTAFLTALTNASKAIRPGEAKLEKATAAQKANQVVCSSQVLLPLQHDALVAGELHIGSAAARGVAVEHELQRMRTLPCSGTPHAATAFILSAGTRLEGDAQGAVPVNMVQARKDALGCLVGKAKEAVGRRRLTKDVRAKVDAMCEALLAGTIDLDAAVELLGGVAPADHTQLFGYAEADGTWGKISNREEIKRALALVLDMIHAVHVPLLGMDTGAKGDFGLGQLFVEARLATVDRLATTLREAFGLFTAQCEEYRESLSAAAPCLQSALARAIETALKPLAREQQVKRAAELAAREVASQIAKDAAAKSTAGGASAADVAKLRSELAQFKRAYEQGDAGTPAPRGHATPHEHMTT